ncbi:kinase [Mycoplasmopsis maculosa]|uniref:Kinase n=1 Tax=Mycoplasmopsis maculosa TaxID=114885 RepID=A0A449B5H3_9BACT|nr:DAK2 domain-containing protein [Mycoplasmopsis maculosa]VEU75826.1 kinase [Mycoplasmopsis maculosa]
MIKKKIDGKIYSELITSGANNLINNKNRIDALNVFPVPDGDTGTNMSSTVEMAAKALENYSSDNLGEVANFVAKNMLLGARGNSGVILSQIFKGFALAFSEKEEVDILGFLEGFKKATEKAYGSVLKPIEGTILTVIRETTESLEAKINNFTSFEELFKAAFESSRIACDNTPNKLKILREVGVTDSGGEGLHNFIEGIYKYFKGEPVKISNDETSIDTFISNKEVYNGEFGYCTEFIIELNSIEDFDKKQFEKQLNKKANSLVVVQDDKLVKVHGHTLKPGDLLNFGQKFGEFIKIKSENMTIQAEDSRNKNVVLNNIDKKGETKKCGIVSCNLGSGIIEKMRELGCDVIIESGQTQNPSALDIIEAIKNCDAENVFILPNNKNIFLTAEQAAQATRDKKVYIIPTSTQIQGINAISVFNSDVSPEENTELMNEMISMVQTGEVTTAVRNTQINGVKIKEGKFISILDGKIKLCVDTYLEAAKKLIKKTANEDTQLITIYYGNEASELDAAELEDYIRRYFECDVAIINGNQPNYFFIIGFE